MPSPAYNFEPQVSDAGYSWVDARVVENDWRIGAEPSRVLVANSTPETKAARTASPLLVDQMTGYYDGPRLSEEGGLFRNFAALPETEEAILGFAIGSGSLFGPERQALAVPTGVNHPKRKPKSSLSHRLLHHPTDPDWHRCERDLSGWLEAGCLLCDTLQQWQIEIGRMRFLVDVWEALRYDDNKRLGELIRYSDVKGSDLVAIAPILNSSGILPADMPKPRSGGRAVAVSRWLESAATDFLQGRLTPEVLNDEENDVGTLVFRTDHLIDALWLQFVDAICETKDFQTCSICGTWFDISATGAREDKTLCSPACTAKSYRQRKKHAKRLRAEGKMPSQIAKVVGSDTATVKRWLSSAKKRRRAK